MQLAVRLRSRVFARKSKALSLMGLVESVGVHLTSCNSFRRVTLIMYGMHGGDPQVRDTPAVARMVRECFRLLKRDVPDKKKDEGGTSIQLSSILCY